MLHRIATVLAHDRLTFKELNLNKSETAQNHLWEANAIIKGSYNNYTKSEDIEQRDKLFAAFSKFVALYFEDQLSYSDEVLSVLTKCFLEEKVADREEKVADIINSDELFAYVLHPEKMYLRLANLFEQRKQNIENYPTLAKLLRDNVVNAIFSELVEEKRERLCFAANIEAKTYGVGASQHTKLAIFNKHYVRLAFENYSNNISSALSNIKVFYYTPSSRDRYKVLPLTALLLGVYYITSMAADSRQSARSMSHLITAINIGATVISLNYGNKLIESIKKYGCGNVPKKLAFQTAILLMRNVCDGLEMFGYFPRGLKISITGKITSYLILDHIQSIILTPFLHYILQSHPKEDKRNLIQGSNELVRMSKGVDLDQIVASMVEDNKVDQKAAPVVQDNKIDRRIVAPIAPGPDKKPDSVKTGNHRKSCLQRFCSFFYSSTPSVNTRTLSQANNTNHRKQLHRRKIYH